MDPKLPKIFTIKSCSKENLYFSSNVKSQHETEIITNKMPDRDNSSTKNGVMIGHIPLEKEHDSWTENTATDNEDGKQNTKQMVHSRTHANVFTKLCANIFLERFDKSPFLQGCCGGFILIVAFAITTIITSFPQHDVILYTNYWYEPCLIAIAGFYIICTVNTMAVRYTIMKTNIILSWSSFWKLYVSSSLGFSISYVSIYMIWVHLLQLRHPMPFIGKICMNISYGAKCVSFWFLFPLQERKNDIKFRKRLVASMILFPVLLLVDAIYTFMQIMFFSVPETQICIVIASPLVKWFITLVVTKVSENAAGNKELNAKVPVIGFVGCYHSMFMILLLGSTISSEIACILITLESIPNVVLCLKIIKLNRQAPYLADGRETDGLRCLALKELFEMLMPALYCSTFLVAFYGPNSKIFGNIGNNYWHFQRVQDVFEKLKKIAIFSLIDALRCMIISMSLWKFAKLNLYTAYCHIVHNYGILILVQVTSTTVMVVCYCLI